MTSPAKNPKRGRRVPLSLNGRELDVLAEALAHYSENLGAEPPELLKRLAATIDRARSRSAMRALLDGSSRAAE